MTPRSQTIKKQSVQRKAALVVLATGPYIELSRQVFSSASNAGNWQYDRVLLTDTPDDPSLDDFRRAGIIIMKVRPLVDAAVWDSRVNHGRGNLRLAKISLFSSAFQTWRNIVFLDADIIVRGPISHLAEVTGFWAAPDHNHRLRHQFIDNGACLESAYAGNSLSFNSGVMAFDTSRNSDAVIDEIRTLAHKYMEYLRWSDQPILNLFFYQKWNSLCPAYNYFPNWMAVTPWSNSKNAIILHFPMEDFPDFITGPFAQLWKANRAAFCETPKPAGRQLAKRFLAQGHWFARWQILGLAEAYYPILYSLLKRLKALWTSRR